MPVRKGFHPYYNANIGNSGSELRAYKDARSGGMATDMYAYNTKEGVMGTAREELKDRDKAEMRDASRNVAGASKKKAGK